MDRNGMSSLSSVSASTKTAIATIVLAFVCVVHGNGVGERLMTVSVANASGSPVVVNNGQAVGTIQLFTL